MNFDEADKTDWFSGTVAPARDGVYEREYADDDGSGDRQRFALFTRGEWKIGNRTVKLAAEQDVQSLYKVGDSDFVWRGLKADPNAVVITPEVHVVAHNAPGLALDSGEFIPAEELNESQPEEDLF